eukprot:g10680.t1 g10680   contig4:2327905-2328450(+)
MSSFMRDINTNGDTDTAADPAAFGESGNGSTEPDASHHNTAAESVAWSTEDDAKLMNAYRKANTINISSDGSTQIDYDDYKTWDAISQQMTPARTSVQCLLRYLKLNSKNKPNKKRKLDDTVTIEESAQKEVPAEENHWHQYQFDTAVVVDGRRNCSIERTHGELQGLVCVSVIYPLTDME